MMEFILLLLLNRSAEFLLFDRLIDLMFVDYYY